MPKLFPDGFLWGAATSAHQIEGGLHNDWSEWEKANAERLAHQSQVVFGQLPSWPHIRQQATDPANYLSGQAADHWHRFESDFDLAQQLGLTAYRFSIDWSRVEPKEGQFDIEAIAHYQKMIDALHVRGIEPFVTIWHWPLPLWLSQRGGWLAADAVEQFAGYADKLATELTGVKFWITLNEPEVYAGNGYFTGVWPPGQKNPINFLRLRRRLISGHKAGYDAIKLHQPEAQIGIAANLTWFVAANHNPLNHLIASAASRFNNHHFLKAIGRRQDFIGLNHYFCSRVSLWRFSGPRKLGSHSLPRRSDLGWDLVPEAIYQVLGQLQSYQLPIYITENGLADASDHYRSWFIEQTLHQVHQAIADGADVRGYLHWSLLDNFEWDKGFWPRFGLIEVDFQTQRRTIRPSAKVYAQIIKQNGLD